MTKLLRNLLGMGLIAACLSFTAAQAQNDLAAPETGPVAVELTAPVPLPQMRGGLLYDNGPLVNSPATGVGGADESVLQTVSLGMGTLGFGHQANLLNFVSDDFTVPAPGWDINEVVTYAYQSGAGPGPSTMTSVIMCIWDGPPSSSPNAVWGDCATNVMTSTSFSNILRVTETTTGTASDRAVMAQTSSVVVSLAPGTYWIEWATAGSTSSGPWAPPITITGQTTTGNSEQCIGATTGAACNPAVDGGTATPQGFPFQLYGVVVPVELVSFTGMASGTNVSLNWATSSETNNAGFEVQVQNGESWSALGFVEGHGTTTEAQVYSFAANDMAVGTYSFRLKQIDFDGRFEYFGDVEVAVETPGTHILSAAYPNPFNPQSQFTLAVAQDQRVSAELYNTLGQRVAVLFSGTVEANQTQTLTIDGAGLASGMYIVRVNGERFNDALSVTLLK